MRLNNLIYKFHTWLKNLCIKIFGNNRKSYTIIKLVIAFMISTDFFYYIADRGYPWILVIAGCTLAFYIIVSIGAFILKYLLNFIKRFHTMNIVLFSGVFYFTYSIMDRVKNEGGLSDIQFWTIITGFSILVFVFSKMTISLFINKKKASIPFFAASGLCLAGIVFFLIWGGIKEQSAMQFAKTGNKSLKTPANFASDYFDYGSKDSESVNLLDYVSYSGKKKKIRDKYFGMGLDKVPLKGKVWYPKNKKGSPVLFIAHGNHRFTTENYMGYDFLGRYLARRGYVVISVDMNMLNGFMKYGLGGENDARAILLLENIRKVLELNKDNSSPMYGLIDENNIAISGHSRGGEAAVIANSFNTLKYNPDNGKNLNYNFNIKGVVSIAPTADQYMPSGKSTTMTDVNYLVLHGTNDKDVSGFQGMRLYDNVKFTGKTDNFKTAVYIGYANHGQFNELWGSYDADPPERAFTNRKELLKSDTQKNILCLYITDFLDNTFGFKNDRGLFKNPEIYKLPKTIYYSRYADSTFNNLEDFEGDYDLTVLKNGYAEFSGMAKVSEEEISIGGYDTGNTGLYLSNYGSGKYNMYFNKDYDALNYLQFDIKSTKNEGNTSLKKENFYVELVDIYGNHSKVNVNDYIKIYPNIKVQVSKLQLLSKDYEYKGSLQTVRIPIDDFIVNSKIVRTNIKQINFIFGKDFTNSYLIDNIGFSD